MEVVAYDSMKSGGQQLQIVVFLVARRVRATHCFDAEVVTAVVVSATIVALPWLRLRVVNLRTTVARALVVESAVEFLLVSMLRWLPQSLFSRCFVALVAVMNLRAMGATW